MVLIRGGERLYSGQPNGDASEILRRSPEDRDVPCHGKSAL